MDLNRLFRCRGDGLVYIRHLELRILELESACSSRYPEALGTQQQISGQCRPCEVCRNPNIYQGLSSQEISADSIRLASESSPDNQPSSADTTRRAPESSDDNQPSQHNRSPERTYAFIPYAPLVTTASSAAKGSSTLTKPAQKKKDRLSSFTSSVGNLPESSAWKNWASINETQRKNVIVSLVSGLESPKDDNPILSEQPTTISILVDQPTTISLLLEFGTSGLVETLAESIANRPFACFRELIICSLSAVALEFNPKEQVFQAMRTIFCCDAQPKALRGRIRGAKWANRAIYLLSRTNWGPCSWDIIYVASNHVNFYSEFNDYLIKPEEFIKGLKPEFNPECTQTISVPLAIPSIIRSIFRDQVPLEKICECLGYEFGDYNKLDLSGLENLFVVPAANIDPNDTVPTNTEPTNTEPTNTEPANTEPANTEPNYAGPNDTTSNHATPNKKRTNGPLKTPSKRRCLDISSSSPEGDDFETFNGSHWSIHATPAPSAPGSCSNPMLDGLFEELPTSTSSPTQDLLGIDGHEEMVGSRIGCANRSALTSNHSTQQSILPHSHVDLLLHQGDSIPDPVMLRDTRSRTSSARGLIGRNNTIGNLIIYCRKGFRRMILNYNRGLTGYNNMVGNLMVYCRKGFRRMILNYRCGLTGRNNALSTFCSRIFR
ncbi:hypothetical protein DTO013F2_10327 [Penicillium roqueforti]|nr:hypothetical protein DTO013F2_10327 [Penicillium roqueforti]